MALTDPQLQTLKADIAPKLEAGQPFEGLDPLNTDHCFVIADYYNADSNPAVIVWKTSVTRQEILQNGFDWTRLDNLSVGKARVWNDIFVDDVINPAKPNVRVGIDSVWVGTAPDLAVRAAVYIHCKKTASRIQAMLASGTGTDATPATMTFDGTINFQDVLNSNNV